MRAAIPLVGPSYESRELPLSAQRTKNIYASLDPEASTFSSHHGFPGLKEWSDTSGGAFRGDHVANGIYYAVCGNTLYKTNAAGTASSVGTIAGTGMCDLTNDPEHLVIVTGSTAYQLLFSTDVLTVISDPDLINPTTVDYLNGHFIYDTQSVQGAFIVSDVNDPDSIQSADEATAESHPDDILRAVVYNQAVYFFGSDTIEPWWNTGIGNPPFDRIQGGVRPYGIASPWAVAVDDDDMFFLDNNRVPQVVNGLQVSPIGNNALGKEWNSYADVSDAVGSSFILDHQKFFVLTFPSANRTWAYHVPSNSWFQLSNGVNDDRWKGSSYQFAYGKHLVADHTNGKIYELDFDTFTDDGGVIQRQRTTASIHGGLYGSPGANMFFEKVEFVCQVGEGINVGQGSDPQLMVRYSDDGGKTYSAQEFYPLGAGGDYLRKVELVDQGQAYQRLYELTYSDPTPFALFSAHADISLTNGPS